MTPLLVMYVGAGLLLSALSLPLILKKVGPNPVYGFRVRQTLEDPEVWYEVNAFAGKGMLFDGMITVIAALVLALVPGISVDRYALSVTAIVFLAMGITLYTSVRHLRRITRSNARSS